MFNTLFKMVIGVVEDRFSRVFSRISGSAAGFSREALRTAAVLALVATPLLAPQSAHAMNNWETAIVANYPGTSLSMICANCHGDWGGRAVGNPLRADYWIWGFGGGETPPAASPFYSNDHDMDGTTTGQEYANSQTASPGPAVTLDWFPSFPDKDNDGYIQLYNRLGDTGMPNQALGVTADGWIGGGRGFIGYGPKGWDQDDNDPLKGNSTAWPTTSTPGTFVNPVATTDDGNPTTELPAAITNFRASGQIADAIPLVWTAVGDDGMTGDAHSYDLRYTTRDKAFSAKLCGVGNGVGTSACDVRNRGHWSRMYDLIGGTADNGPCNVLSKTGLVISCIGGLWNSGDTTSPLMRAFYEPVPTAPGSNQGCSTAPGQSATCTLTAAPAPSYVLKTQGIAGPKGAPVNVIADGQLYWLANRVSDGVLQITGTLGVPTGFTENVSMSNIVAITAGINGASITSVTAGANIIGTSGTISVTGLGLTSANASRLALVSAVGTTIAFAPATPGAGNTTSSASFTGLAAGTYTLETQTAAGATTAAWVDAVTVVAVPPVFTSITPGQAGRGATSRPLTLGGSDLAGGTLTFTGTGIASVPVSGSGPFTASINVDPGASLGLRDATVTTTGGTSSPPVSFTVTAAPTFTCNPAISLNGTVGVAYTTSVCTASGGSPAGTSYTWTPTALPNSVTALVSGTNSETYTISGKPSVAGTFLTTIKLSDGNGGTTTTPYNILIAKGTPTITWPTPAPITYPTPLSATQLNASVTNPATLAAMTGGSFVYTPASGAVLNANPSPQSLSVTFTPSAADSLNFNPVTTPNNIVVNPASQVVTINCPASLQVNQSGTCTASSTSGLTGITFTATGSCTVTSAGAVTAGSTAATACSVTATTALNSNYTPNPASSTPASITITKLTQSISLTCTPTPIPVNGTSICTASALSGLPVILTNDTPSVCSLAGNTVTGTIGGDCKITATQPGDPTYEPAPSVTATVVVTRLSQTVTVTCTPTSIPVNGNSTCTGSASPSGLPVTLSNTTPSVCSLVGNTVTGTIGGNCLIGGSQAGSSVYAPATATPATVVVTKLDQTISLSCAPTSIPVNGTSNCVASSSSGLSVTLSNTTPSVCSLVGGTVTGTIGGDCVIAAAQDGSSVYNPASNSTTVTVTKLSQTVDLTCPASININTSGTCTATASATPVTFTASSGTGSCSIDSAGVVSAVAPAGPEAACTVTASQAGTPIYSPASTTANISITDPSKKTPVVSWPTPAPITYGAALSATQLIATATDPLTSANVPGTFSYTPGTDGLGIVLGAGSRPLSSTFTPTDTAVYNSVITPNTLLVNRADQTIGTITFTPATLVAGGTTTASATATSGLPVTTFSSMTPTICTVSGSVVIGGAKSKGTCSVHADQEGDSNYNPAPQLMQDITVTRNVDMIMTTVSKTAASVGIGHNFVITNIARNQGTTPAVATTVAFYLSLDATITTADIKLTGVRAVPVLAAMTSSASAATIVTVPYSVSALMPSTVWSKVYYVGACADVPNVQPEETLAGVLLESNNCKAATGTVPPTIIVKRNVDLQMPAVSKTATVVGVGKTFTITNTEKNLGTTHMTAPSNTVKFYLSTDAIISTTDILIGSRVVNRLLAGQGNTLTTTVTVPGTVLPKAGYYVGACADAPSVQIEASLTGAPLEANNCKAAAGTITVVRNVDLVVSALSSADDTVVEGLDFTITSTVKNVGTAAMLATPITTTRYYLSTDAIITSTDTLLVGTSTVAGLAAGASITMSTIVTLPDTVLTGVYFIGAIADGGAIAGVSQLLESVETNNSNSNSPTPSTDTISVIFEVLLKPRL